MSNIWFPPIIPPKHFIFRAHAGNIPVFQFPFGRKMYIDKKDIEDFIKKTRG